MVTIPQDVAATVKEFRRRLVERFGERLISVRLYGSYARGEAGPDSDVDVHVVVRDLGGDERGEIREMGVRFMIDRGMPISTLADSDREWEMCRSREWLIARDIEEHGVPF